MNSRFMHGLIPRHLGTYGGLTASCVLSGQDRWDLVWKQLKAICPKFNKNTEACRHKYRVLMKEYRSDKAVNATSGAGRQEKCK